jgi:inward rectifier potassium channel
MRLPGTSSEPRSRIFKFGDRQIVAKGLPGGFWTDVYYRAMTVSWPRFFGSAAAIFLVLNVVFATVYSFGKAPVANVRSDGMVDLLYFSIETLATVGYGDMHPQSDYGHLVATIEIFTGMSFLAVMTGLVFARFSRPRARFIFARYPVVAMFDGVPTLMIRMANARHNTISRATARLWLIRAEETAEGVQLRRYHELALQRRENPIFVLSWTVFHVIQEGSPLFGASAEDLAQVEAVFVLTVSGHDDNAAIELNARRSYAHDDIRWNARYVDILAGSSQGQIFIDYGKFDAVTPEARVPEADAPE